MALPVTMDGLAGLTDLYLQDNLLSCLPDTAGERGGGGGFGEGSAGGFGGGFSGRGLQGFWRGVLREGSAGVFREGSAGVFREGSAGTLRGFLEVIRCIFSHPGKLPNLIVLNLENNRLGSLPETIDG